MPTYEITGPDGRKFKITGPNKEGALAALQAQLAGAPTPQEGGINPDTDGPMEGFGAAFKQGIDAPLENIGETLEVLGATDAGANLRGLTDAPEGYASASERFINDPAGEDKGFGWRYLPKAVVEQAGQLGGSLITRAGGAAVGGAAGSVIPVAGTTGGVAVGAFAGPALFEAIQVLGPVANARARNDGRDKPNIKDFVYASGTAAGMGALNAIGVRGGSGLTSALREGGTEALQSATEQTGSTVATEAGLSVDPRQAVGEGIIGGASMGTIGAAKGAINRATPAPREDTPEARAEATFAQRIQGITEANGIDLRDVDTASTTGAREAVDKAHVQIAEDLKQTFSDLKGLVKPTDLDALGLVQDKVLAQAAYREGRNKTKNVVGKQEFDALDRLTGQTLEGQRALNLLREMNVLTKIHNDGYKGGLSQYTDTANPFDTSQNTYNAAAQVSGKVLGPLATATAAYSTGGTSIPIQAGVALGGRGIDKVTGRRSRLNRFVKQNANNPGIETPTGLPSIRQERIDEAAAAQRAQEAEDADAAVRTEQRKQTNRRLAQAGAPPTEGSPQDIVQVATGLDRSGVAQILRTIERTKTDPVILDAIKAYRSSVDVGGRVPDMSPLIREIKQMAKEMGVRGQDTGTAQAAAAGSPIQTTSENYQRGIDDNKATLQDLKDRAKTDATMSPTDKAKVSQALDQLGMNLGSDPAAKVNEIMGTLEGVEPDAVAQYVEPYVMRVMGQQNAAARNQLATPLFNDPLEIDGKITVKAIGEALNQDHLNKHGRQFFPEQDEADYQQVLEFADQEMSEQLKQPNSGVGWYSKDVDTSMQLASKVFPTLATNQEHRRLYLTFAGIFSNGADPDNAFIMSSWAFDDFLRTGEIPINRAKGFIDRGLEPPKTTFKDTRTKKKVTKDAGWGIRNQANEQQLGMLKYLVEEKGSLSAAMDFLLSPQDRTAINDIMLESGLYKAGRFTTKAEKAGPPEYGFLAFGKKLGRYSMGLQGVDIEAGDTTIDLWYTRTFRRWSGRLLETPIGKEGVAAQPANDTERNAIFRLTGELAKKYNLPVGDVQALLWFFEKRTWGAQGLKTKEGTNSSGARKLLEQRGIPENDDPARSNGPSVRNSQPPVTGGQPQGDGILSGGANPSNNPVRSRAPEVPEVKQETALVNASIEIGKPGSEFENGIKDMAGVEKLAAAYDIALKFYNSNPEMRQTVPSAAKGAVGAYSPRKRTANVVSTGDLQELITALHETMHGVGVGNIATGNFLGETRTTNGLTDQSDVMGINSLESVMDFVLGKGKSNHLRREVLAELKHIQERAMFSTSGVQAPIRGSKSMATMLKNAKRELEADGQNFEGQKAKVRKKLKDFQTYERSIGELTVDALQLYAHDPKTMKRVAPQTARMIRELFQKSGNKKIQFYSHPLAMVVAVVMAIMAKAGTEDEEEQQLPPGMLSPQPGMLTA